MHWKKLFSEQWQLMQMFFVRDGILEAFRDKIEQARENKKENQAKEKNKSHRRAIAAQNDEDNAKIKRDAAKRKGYQAQAAYDHFSARDGHPFLGRVRRRVTPHYPDCQQMVS